MNIKEIIEQKAREYANSQLKKGYIEGKPNFTCVDLDFAYKAGAEAAIEIANAWITLKDEKPLDGQAVIVRNEKGGMAIYRKDARKNFTVIAGYCENPIEWKSITI